MKISRIFLEFYPERTTFRKKSNKNSFEESFFILTSAILKVPSFIKDSFECHSNQFIGLIYNVWSIEIVSRGGPPPKMGGPPLEFINIQPKKGGSASRIHQPKGGPPLESINQRGVRL